MTANRDHPSEPTREAVARLLGDGLSRAAIARTLGLTKPTIAYHARRLGRPVEAKFCRRHDWSAIQAYYDDGHSFAECQERFGFARKSWFDAVARGALVTRPRAMPVETLLAQPRSRAHLKRRLIGAGLLEERCARCGIVEWLGARLALELHHVNGIGDDNRLENLTLLCPNCHSQTETWGGRNRRPVALAAGDPG